MNVTEPQTEAASLFNTNRLPHRPYAADFPVEGVYRMNPEQAMQRRNMQVNPRDVAFWLLADVDTPDAAGRYIDAGLPDPHWIAQNPENGHAHYAWGIASPVTIRSPRSMYYLSAIQRGFWYALDADFSYGGMLTKNPLNPCWRTFWHDVEPFTLAELADYVRLDLRRAAMQESALGRNCLLFDILRHWAYKAVREYLKMPPEKAMQEMRAAALDIVQAENLKLDYPLPYSELRAIAKSVTRWTRSNFSNAAFSAIQSKRGQASGAKRKSASEERRERLMPAILEMVGQGHSQRVIADTLGVPDRTIRAWMKKRQ